MQCALLGTEAILASLNEDDEACRGGLSIVDLPTELLCHILGFLSAPHLGTEATSNVTAWCLTCSTFDAACDSELRYRCRCFAACPVLFGLALSPLFGAPLSSPPLLPEAVPTSSPKQVAAVSLRDAVPPDDDTPSTGEATWAMEHSDSSPSLSSSSSIQELMQEAQQVLTWKLRAQLLPYLPRRLVDKGTKRSGVFGFKSSANPAYQEGQVPVVDEATGRTHTNIVGDLDNLITDRPLLNTNDNALLEAIFDSSSDKTSGPVRDDRMHDDGFAISQEPASSPEEESTSKNEDDGMERDLHRALVQTLLYRGVDYFEMSVLRGTTTTNRCVAIGLAQWFEAIEFIGWDKNTIAYHSDDGTVRSDVQPHDVFAIGSEWLSDDLAPHQWYGWRQVLCRYTTGDVVGCGIDWDNSEVFFVYIRSGTTRGSCNRWSDADVRPEEGEGFDVEVFVRKCPGDELARKPWYPAIGSVCLHDVLLINTGQQPFAFDIRDYVQRRRTRPSA